MLSSTRHRRSSVDVHFVVAQIDPHCSFRLAQLGPMPNCGVDLLSLGAEHHDGVHVGRKPGLVARRLVDPFDPPVECARHDHYLLLTRNGLSIVNASGRIPPSMRFQVTGAAIGNRSRARGE